MLDSLMNETAIDANKALAEKRVEQEAAQSEVEGMAEPLPPIIDPPLPPEEPPAHSPATDLPLPLAPSQPGDVPQEMPDPVRARD